DARDALPRRLRGRRLRATGHTESRHLRRGRGARGRQGVDCARAERGGSSDSRWDGRVLHRVRRRADRPRGRGLLLRSRWSDGHLSRVFGRDARRQGALRFEPPRPLVWAVAMKAANLDTIAPLVLRVESLVRQLQVLAQSLDLVESRIQELAAAFEDYAFFRALPGAGCAFAPRLLAAYGEDRSRWTSASALQCYSGIAPVTRQSGNTRSVVRRLHCPNFRRQSFHEWAAENWKHSRWARAFVRYHQSRE